MIDLLKDLINVGVSISIIDCSKFDIRVRLAVFSLIIGFSFNHKINSIVQIKDNRHKMLSGAMHITLRDSFLYFGILMIESIIFNNNLDKNYILNEQGLIIMILISIIFGLISCILWISHHIK